VEELESFPTLPRNHGDSIGGKRLQLSEAETLLAYIKRAEEAGLVGNVIVSGGVLRFNYEEQVNESIGNAVAAFRANLLKRK
jgi:hypothetical protein